MRSLLGALLAGLGLAGLWQRPSNAPGAANVRPESAPVIGGSGAPSPAPPVPSLPSSPSTLPEVDDFAALAAPDFHTDPFFNAPPPFEPSTVRPGAGWQQPTEWDVLFAQTERAHRMPVGLLKRVAWQESRYNPRAVSPAGALGLMQIVPRWHPDAEPFDPVLSISYAGRFLADLYTQFGGWRLALAAYNWGPGNVRRALREGRSESTWPTETQRYMAQIGADVGLA